MVYNNCALYMLLYKQQCRGFCYCSKRVVNARSVFQEHHLVRDIYQLKVTVVRGRMSRELPFLQRGLLQGKLPGMTDAAQDVVAGV